jgi:Leucine-rich repeat (LRR) protein/serine/threonine protein kinase
VQNHNERAQEGLPVSSLLSGDDASSASKLKLPAGPTPVFNPLSKMQHQPPSILPGSASLHRPTVPAPAIEVPILPSASSNSSDDIATHGTGSANSSFSASTSQTGETSANSLQIVFQGRGYTEFPKRILETQGFSSINGSGNSLSSLPIGLASRTAITRLEFADNQFKELPLVITELPHLQYLDFSKNKISLLAPAITSTPALTALLLANNRMKSFPDHICQLLQLEILDLSGNRLKSIPSQIGDLSALKILSLANCELSTIPSEFEKLRNLEKLVLDHNNLSRLPGGTGSMISLKTLDLGYNMFASAPENLFYLSSLTELNLERNEVEVVGEDVWRLSALKSLNLEFNRLSNLPVELCTLPELVTLKFSGNALSSIPSEFHTDMSTMLEYLKRLKLQSSWKRRKLVFVGEENVGKTSLRMQLTSSFATKQSRKKRKHRGTELQNSTSSSAITTAGTSSAIAELADPVATDGIDIEDWEPLGTDEDGLEPIVFNTWDFAGQNIYHPTHQFFITNRSVYLIIFNLLDERSSKVEYWLKTLRVRADGRCPVVIVGTHVDDRKCDAKYVEATFKSMRRKYSHRFPFVREYVAVSSKTGKGLGKLTETLVSLARSNTSFHNIPDAYTKLEKSILQIRTTANTLSLTDFSGVAVQAGVEPSNMSSCLQFFHDVGLVMYFDDKNAGLRDLVILDPLWIANLLSSIITLKHSYAKDGIMMASSLSQIWKEYPSSEYKWMLNLLDKFEITFRISALMSQGTRNFWIRHLIDDQSIPGAVTGEEPKSHQRSNSNSNSSSPALSKELRRESITSDSKLLLDDMIVIPSLLPLKPAESYLNDLWADSTLFTGHVTGRRYIFQFLPLGFFSRLLVRILHLSGVNPQYLWRNGMIVDSDSERAILLHNELDFQLDIVVKKKRNSDSSNAGGKTANLKAEDLASPPRRATISMSAVDVLRQLSDCIETLLVSWFKLKVIVKVPCYICLAEKMQNPDVQPYYFPIEECMLAVREGKHSVVCLASPSQAYELSKGLAKDGGGRSSTDKRNKAAARVPLTTADAIFVSSSSLLVPPSPRSPAPEGQDDAKGSRLSMGPPSPRPGGNTGNSQKESGVSSSVAADSRDQTLESPLPTPGGAEPKFSELAAAGLSVDLSNAIGSGLWNGANFQQNLTGGSAHNNQQQHICSLQDLCPDIAFMDLRDLTINFEDLNVGKVIGEGSYAELRTGTYNGETVAVKVLKQQASSGGTAQQMDMLSDSFRELQHETFVMKNLQNPYLVALKGICTQPLAMVMDYFPLGSLDRHLREPTVQHPCLSWKYRVRLGLNIARGMDYLHSEDFIHRDLRSPNILIASRDENEPIIAKVADFGLAVICAKEIKGGDFNECWTAPEILAASAYNSKVDQYSFGIVMWELLELGHPFKEYEEVYSKLPRLDFFEAIINGLRPTFPENCPVDYIKLVSACWTTDPGDRPTFARIADILAEMEPIAAKWDAGDLSATASTSKAPYQSTTLRHLLKKKSKGSNLHQRLTSSPSLNIQ